MGTEDNVIRFVIGVFVSLGASFMDALGLNILKVDHVKESKRSQDQQRGDCGRPLWHLGLYTYIASQLIGSTIALNYLKTQWVAPLGSVALIFNFIFAKLLVNTKITRKDVLGTCVVIASVIWIVVFGGIALNIIAFGGLFISIWSNWAISDESRKRKSQIFSGMNQKKMKRVVGLMFSTEGGVLASETLLLAKSGVKLFTLSVSSQVNQFNDNASRFILLALLVTAILQVYCLNTALKLYTSVVVVPVFYGTYTALGLVNTIIYLDEISNYPPWAIALVFVGIGVLIYGVFLLSSKPDPTSQHQDDLASVSLSTLPPSAQPSALTQQELDVFDNLKWLSAKEEKDVASKKEESHKLTVDPGESSNSKVQDNKDEDNSRINKFFRRFRVLRFHPKSSPFVSIYSSIDSHPPSSHSPSSPSLVPLSSTNQRQQHSDHSFDTVLSDRVKP
ncbi:magnesium transporter NIPA-domain-containing protein [Blakeslea trispora]|nr:magnesium transporter NIPA-domain-containing protein [Blakeslea trispora]